MTKGKWLLTIGICACGPDMVFEHQVSHGRQARGRGECTQDWLHSPNTG